MAVMGIHRSGVVISPTERARIALAIEAVNLDRVAWQLRHPSHGEEPTDGQVVQMISRYK